MTGEHIDLTGKRFGKLVVSGASGKTRAHMYIWRCVCDCGKSTDVITSNLKRGNTRSCGCARRKENRNLVMAKKFFVNFGVYARARRHEFSLNFDEFIGLVQENCYYCGTKPSNTYTYEWTGEKYKYSGLDRIDSTKGYRTGNVLPCCKKCNFAKNDMSFDEFRDWVKRVHKHLNLP